MKKLERKLTKQEEKLNEHKLKLIGRHEKLEKAGEID
jgi:ribosome-associated translation inhibitor RaiA